MSTYVGRAVVIRKKGGPEVLEIEPSFTFPAPEVEEVLVKAAAFSINPIDYIVRNGAYGSIPHSPTVRPLQYRHEFMVLTFCLASDPWWRCIWYRHLCAPFIQGDVWY